MNNNVIIIDLDSPALLRWGVDDESAEMGERQVAPLPTSAVERFDIERTASVERSFPAIERFDDER